MFRQLIERILLELFPTGRIELGKLNDLLNGCETLEQKNLLNLFCSFVLHIRTYVHTYLVLNTNE